MTLKMILSGNTYDVKEALKVPPHKFDYNPQFKNWSRTVESIDDGVSLLAPIEEKLTEAGVRVAAFKSVNGLDRLVWWKDFGRVRENRGNEDEGVPVPSVPTVPNDLSIGQVITGAQTGRISSGSVSSQPASRERVIRIPQWLARELGVATAIRGEITEEARRDVSLRGNNYNAQYIHVLGHNEVGNTDRCHRCHRPLTHPVSRVVGYGPECCEALGISRRVDMNDLNNVELLDRLIREQRVDVWIPRRYCAVR
jgi:hypothetical protein